MSVVFSFHDVVQPALEALQHHRTSFREEKVAAADICKALLQWILSSITISMYDIQLQQN